MADLVLNQLREHSHDCIMVHRGDESVLLDFGYGPRDKVKPEKWIYRYDSVGLKECEEDFAYFARCLQTKRLTGQSKRDRQQLCLSLEIFIKNNPLRGYFWIISAQGACVRLSRRDEFRG